MVNVHLYMKENVKSKQEKVFLILIVSFIHFRTAKIRTKAIQTKKVRKKRLPDEKDSKVNLAARSSIVRFVPSSDYPAIF